jgi:hypothetical protein
VVKLPHKRADSVFELLFLGVGKVKIEIQDGRRVVRASLNILNRRRCEYRFAAAGNAIQPKKRLGLGFPALIDLALDETLTRTRMTELESFV